METKATTIAEKLSALKPKHWALLALGVVALLFLFSSGSSGVDPATWDCESIKDDIVTMSQEEDLEVLEIGDVLSESKTYNSLACRASAEWSRGYGTIEYGARVSDGGNVILQYRQQ